MVAGAFVAAAVPQALVFVLNVAWTIHTREEGNPCPYDFEGAAVL